MQYEWAQPGRLVVCVDGSRKPDRVSPYDEVFPEKGRVYTLRTVGEIGVRLVEIRNRPQKYIEGVMEPAFNIRRFRPVNTQIIDNLLKVEENA